MAVSVALYQPDIPQNAGTIIRMCACLGTAIHIIHPTGFIFSDKNFRRAGMDYAAHADIIEHDDFAAFETWRAQNGRRLVLATTKATASVYSATYTPDDILLMGRESAGVPAQVAAAADLPVRIPMVKNLRSINVAISAALMLGEAKRQTDRFEGLS